MSGWWRPRIAGLRLAAAPSAKTEPTPPSRHWRKTQREGRTLWRAPPAGTIAALGSRLWDRRQRRTAARSIPGAELLHCFRDEIAEAVEQTIAYTRTMRSYDGLELDAIDE